MNFASPEPEHSRQAINRTADAAGNRRRLVDPEDVLQQFPIAQAGN